MLKNLILNQHFYRNSIIKNFRKWFFTDFETKISRFCLIKSDLESKNLNLEENKKYLISNLSINDNQDLIFEKLNPVIYLGKTEEDIYLILKSIKKLNENGTSKYKIHASFMRLLYTLDRTELALKCFQDDELRKIFMQDLSSSIIILDKLIQDKKYQDVVNFFNTYLIQLKKIPSSILNALTFVYSEMNTHDSLNQMKNLVDLADRKKFLFGLNSVVQIFMFSVRKKDYLYALNFLATRDRINSNVYDNLLAIGYSSLDLRNEALNHLKKIYDQTRPPKIVFVTTINYLDETFKRSDDKNLNESYEMLKIKLAEEKIIKNYDILDFYSKSTEGVNTKTRKKFK